MWNWTLVVLGIRKRSFKELLAKELDEANTDLLVAKKQSEQWKAAVGMYSERVKRLKKELSEEIQEVTE